MRASFSLIARTDAHYTTGLRTNGEVWENCLDVGYPDFRHQGALLVRRARCRLSFRPIPRPGVPASGAPEELLQVDHGPTM